MTRATDDTMDRAPVSPRAAGATVGARFATVLEEGAERIAAADGDRGLTYLELARAAAELGTRIAAAEGPEVPIPLLTATSLALPVAALGAIAARRTYSPLDGRDAPERLAERVAALGALSVVVDAVHAPLAHSLGLRPILCEPEASCHRRGAGRAELVERFGSAAGSDAPPLYVYFTSGSTGAPKGVVDSHANVLDNAGRYLRTLSITPDDRLSLIQSASFSGVVSSLYAALTSGARVELYDLRRRGPDGLTDWLAAREVTIFHSTPAIFRRLATRPRLPRLRLVRLEGDAAHAGDAELFLARYGDHATLVNGLGMTECGLVRQLFVDRATLVCPGLLPVGYPLPGSTIVVIDERGEPIPQGAIGEIAVEGAHLALGYWRAPELTARKFRELPNGARRYATGDLGRLRADGCLEHLGRLDGAPKIAGQWVDLAAVEQELLALPGVTEAAAAIREDLRGEARLVAYLVAPGEKTPHAELRRRVADRLPLAMVPTVWRRIGALPLDGNGKVERRALPAIEGTPPSPSTASSRGEPDEMLSLFRSALDFEQLAPDDDYFDQGGHSLAAIGLLARVRQRWGVELELRDLLAAPTARELGELVAARRLTDRGSEPPDLPPRTVGPESAGGPRMASRGASSLASWQELHPASAAYSVPIALELEGRLDVARLDHSLTAIAARHVALRARLRREGAVHLLDPVPAIAVAHVDFARGVHGLAPNDRAVDDWLAAEVGRPFDLASEPPLRVSLARLAPDRHLLLLVIHHATWDAASLEPLWSELELGYASRALPELESEEEPRPAILATRSHPSRAAPLGVPFAPSSSQRVVAADLRFDETTRAALHAAARRRRTTLAAAGFAALAATLRRTTGIERVEAGMPVSVRSPGSRRIGCFTQTRTVALELGADSSFDDLLDGAREALLAAATEAGAPPRDECVLYSFDEGARRAPLLPGLVVRRREVAPVAAKCDLTFGLWQEDGELRGRLELREGALEVPNPSAFAGLFDRLLRAAVARPGAPIPELVWLPPAERAAEIAAARTAPRRFPKELHLWSIAERWARRGPREIAVEEETGAVERSELLARAANLARELRARGAGEGDRVGIALPRSADAVIATLAVARIGAAWVPLDPDHPWARVRSIATDANLRLVVRRASGPLWPLPWLDAAVANIVGAPEDEPPRRQEVACVLFTSGSSGEPKGVEIPPAAIQRLVWAQRYARVGPRDRLLHAAAIGFDAALFEIWGALAHGARLVIPPADLLPSGVELGRWLAERGITIAFLTTALFHEIARESPASLGALRTLLVGGDRLAPDAVRSVLAAGAPRRLVNVYGPTEATTFATWHRVDALAPETTSIPIGVPLANTAVHVLDGRLEPVPRGLPGQLAIGGDALARGYMERPEETAARFVSDPFGPGRLYLSGDRGRRLADGTLEFLGRVDRQVKIRGFRVEPEELEAAARRQPDVVEAFALARGVDGGTELLLLAVPRAANPSFRAQLRAALRDTLPSFLQPARILEVAELPRTRSGKPDGAACRALAEGRLAEEHPDAERPEPPSDLVGRLLEAMRATLGLVHLRADDDFFEQGGHSLLAGRLLAGLAHDGLRPSFADLYRNPTAAALAAALEAKRTSAPVAVTRSARLFSIRWSPPELWRGHTLGDEIEIVPLAIEPDAAGLATFEELARELVVRARAVQPRGPYRLCGFSVGGLLAFEMAQQFVAAGERVELLALLDPTTPEPFGLAPRDVERLRDRLGRHLRAFDEQSLGDGARYMASRLVGLGRSFTDRWQRLAARLRWRLGMADREPPTWESLALAYRVHPYLGEVDLVETASHEALDATGLWRRLVPRATVHRLGSHHNDLGGAGGAKRCVALIAARFDELDRDLVEAASDA